MLVPGPTSFLPQRRSGPNWPQLPAATRMPVATADIADQPRVEPLVDDDDVDSAPGQTLVSEHIGARQSSCAVSVPEQKLIDIGGAEILGLGKRDIGADRPEQFRPALVRRKTV